AGEVKISIADPSGHTVCTSTGPATAGIHRIQWTLVTPMITADSAAEGRGSATRDLTCDGSGGRGGAGGGRGGAAPAIAAGTYTAKLTVNGHDYTKPV